MAKKKKKSSKKSKKKSWKEELRDLWNSSCEWCASCLYRSGDWFLDRTYWSN